MIIKLKNQVPNLVEGLMEVDSLHKVSDKVGQALVDRDDAEQIDESLVTVTKVGKRWIVMMNEIQEENNLAPSRINMLKEVQEVEEASVTPAEIQDTFTHDVADFVGLPKFQGPNFNS